MVLTDEDFADLPLPTARVVDVLQFVPLEQVDPIYFAKSYYLEPEQSALKTRLGRSWFKLHCTLAIGERRLEFSKCC